MKLQVSYVCSADASAVSAGNQEVREECAALLERAGIPPLPAVVPAEADATPADMLAAHVSMLSRLRHHASEHFDNLPPHRAHRHSPVPVSTPCQRAPATTGAAGRRSSSPRPDLRSSMLSSASVGSVPPGTHEDASCRRTRLSVLHAPCLLLLAEVLRAPKLWEACVRVIAVRFKYLAASRRGAELMKFVSPAGLKAIFKRLAVLQERYSVGGFPAPSEQFRTDGSPGSVASGVSRATPVPAEWPPRSPVQALPVVSTPRSGAASGATPTRHGDTAGTTRGVAMGGGGGGGGDGDYVRLVGSDNGAHEVHRTGGGAAAHDGDVAATTAAPQAHGHGHVQSRDSPLERRLFQPGGGVRRDGLGRDGSGGAGTSTSTSDAHVGAHLGAQTGRFNEDWEASPSRPVHHAAYNVDGTATSTRPAFAADQQHTVEASSSPTSRRTTSPPATVHTSSPRASSSSSNHTTPGSLSPYGASPDSDPHRDVHERRLVGERDFEANDGDKAARRPPTVPPLPLHAASIAQEAAAGGHRVPVSSAPHQPLPTSTSGIADVSVSAWREGPTTLPPRHHHVPEHSGLPEHHGASLLEPSYSQQPGLTSTLYPGSHAGGPGGDGGSSYGAMSDTELSPRTGSPVQSPATTPEQSPATTPERPPRRVFQPSFASGANMATQLPPGMAAATHSPPSRVPDSHEDYHGARGDLMRAAVRAAEQAAYAAALERHQQDVARERAAARARAQAAVSHHARGEYTHGGQHVNGTGRGHNGWQGSPASPPQQPHGGTMDADAYHQAESPAMPDMSRYDGLVQWMDTLPAHSGVDGSPPAPVLPPRGNGTPATDPTPAPAPADVAADMAAGVWSPNGVRAVPSPTAEDSVALSEVLPHHHGTPASPPVSSGQAASPKPSKLPVLRAARRNRRARSPMPAAAAAHSAVSPRRAASPTVGEDQRQGRSSSRPRARERAASANESAGGSQRSRSVGAGRRGRSTQNGYVGAAFRSEPRCGAPHARTRTHTHNLWGSHTLSAATAQGLLPSGCGSV